MEMEGIGENKKAARKVYKMGIRSRRENAEVYGKGGGKKRKDEDENGKKGNVEKLERAERRAEMGGTEEGIL